MIINDPVFGFIDIPDGLLSQLVKHPIFTRLSRIAQLGPTNFVYPGAVHSRFQHSLGAFHLVSQALESLENKGVIILDTEREGVQIAMLLHDLGHGPMSHTLENVLVNGIDHEEITLKLMERLNDEFDGKLNTAIRIFKNETSKHFLHELICSQVDMDRLDYLCRDSFFTGVREGNIGVARIIKMLDTVNDHLTIEEKGIYTIENYLMSRRLMYWQVYLHKTSLAAQEILNLTLQRARELVLQGQHLFTTPSLEYFLKNDVTPAFADKHPEWLDYFISLDDNDIFTSMKQWVKADDKILAMLSDCFINRRLFKAKELKEPISDEKLSQMRTNMAKALNITKEDSEYFVRYKHIGQTLYSNVDEHISILLKNGNACDISDFSELLSSNFTNRQSCRYYLFFYPTKEFSADNF